MDVPTYKYRNLYNLYYADSYLIYQGPFRLIIYDNIHHRIIYNLAHNEYIHTKQHTLISKDYYHKSDYDLIRCVQVIPPHLYILFNPPISCLLTVHLVDLIHHLKPITLSNNNINLLIDGSLVVYQPNHVADTLRSEIVAQPIDGKKYYITYLYQHKSTWQYQHIFFDIPTHSVNISISSNQRKLIDTSRSIHYDDDTFYVRDISNNTQIGTFGYQYIKDYLCECTATTGHIYYQVNSKDNICAVFAPHQQKIHIWSLTTYQLLHQWPCPNTHTFTFMEQYIVCVTNLHLVCTVYIYTFQGELIKTIDANESLHYARLTRDIEDTVLPTIAIADVQIIKTGEINNYYQQNIFKIVNTVNELANITLADQKLDDLQSQTHFQILDPVNTHEQQDFDILDPVNTHEQQDFEIRDEDFEIRDEVNKNGQQDFEIRDEVNTNGEENLAEVIRISRAERLEEIKKTCKEYVELEAIGGYRKFAEDCMVESIYQKLLSNLLVINGKDHECESLTPAGGRIDILTENSIIEIKNGCNVREAVGQVLCYRLELGENYQCIIATFGKVSDLHRRLCYRYSIWHLDLWHMCKQLDEQKFILPAWL